MKTTHRVVTFCTDDLDKTVISLYYLLHDAYRAVFGPEASPDETLSPETNVILQRWPAPPNPINPANPGILLPCHDGWCYSPVWGSPRPIRPHFQYRPALPRGEAEVILKLQNLPDVMEVADRIYRRSWQYRIANYAQLILKNAIAEAENRAGKVNNIVTRPAERLLGSSGLVSELDFAGLTDGTDSEHKAILQAQRLEHLRLMWLRLWYEADKPKWVAARKSLLSDKKNSGWARRDNLSELIKPKDIEDVKFVLETIFKTKNLSPLEMRKVEKEQWKVTTPYG